MKDEYQFVDWEHGDKTHNWKNYIHIDVRNIWNTFSREQKLALVNNAQAIADQEEWD